MRQTLTNGPSVAEWTPTWTQADIDHMLEVREDSDPSASGSHTSPEPIVDTSGSGTPVPERRIDDQAEAAAAAAADTTAAEGVTDTAGAGATTVQQPATMTNIITAAIGVMIPSNVFGIGCSLARSNSRGPRQSEPAAKSPRRANRRNN